MIVDEADAMFRTREGLQKIEQALRELRNLKPCLHIMVTATPQPILLLYKEELKGELGMFELSPNRPHEKRFFSLSLYKRDPHPFPLKRTGAD